MKEVNQMIKQALLVVAAVTAVGLATLNTNPSYQDTNTRHYSAADVRQSSNEDGVKRICDFSRTVDDGQWEELCGRAQDFTGTEYLCNPNVVPECWVEVL